MSNTSSSYPDPQAHDGHGSSGLFVQSHGNHSPQSHGGRKYQEHNSLDVADTAMQDSDAHTLEQLMAEQQMLAQEAMDLQSHPAHDYMPSAHDGQLLASSRKRSKVSRACDECRRKKIRCDATGENGPESCTSCKRSQTSCQFSRQPLKRGPSKGYIKELADRVKLIERNINVPSSSPIASLSTGVQRVYSPPLVSSHSAHDGFSAFTNPFSAVRQPSAPPILGNSPDEVIMSKTSNLNDTEQAYTFQLYTSHLQSVLQFLPEEPTELNIRLSQTPANLRQAFCGAAECLLHTFGQTTQPQYDPQEMISRTSHFLDAAQYECDNADPTFALSNHVMYLVSLVMMIIQADQRHSPLGLSRPGELIGRAVGRANSLSLEDDTKLIEGGTRLLNFGRRVYGALFVLDRYHALSFSANLTMPLYLQPFINTHDRIVGQRETTLLLRIADSIGLYAHILKTRLPSATQDPITHLLAPTTISPLLSALHANQSSLLTLLQLPENSLLHLALHHAELSAARLDSSSPSHTLLHLTNRLLAPLLEPSTPISPLHVHFARLAATSLIDLSTLPAPVGPDALRSIDAFLAALSTRPVVPILPDGTGWDQYLYKVLAAAKAGGGSGANAADEAVNAGGGGGSGSGSATDHISGLQSLAEAAVTESHRPGSSSAGAGVGAGGMSGGEGNIGDGGGQGQGQGQASMRAQATAAAATAAVAALAGGGAGAGSSGAGGGVAGGIEGGLDKALLEFMG
ncbi:hypothetical protein EJ05DRAFT_508838 [Pseudovirgaria hyperparasitica]|uniref:Zn(2)-C6 fungal-type domain-containing protein n=1 Tax=Pseudovirgaria hyperparasitica TaxID=470096 RepID=A0A6A6WE01_9PEZI|nr:uncharacterized protein EJ05DRAFT_508838 [Pseudovirgaria hyperparasitica]KAF2760284.1 hypothetical protein EJ05DRAFT_508838 [Pseudovirgaria hyperparasitica]